MVQYEKILKFISNAKSEGATILTGGSRPEVWLYIYNFFEGKVCFGYVFLQLLWELNFFFFLKFNGSI